jgi:N-acylneuraminate cytidylyltransferase/CMP-N,N'-diacetyllegionaminic acid synthase
VSKIVGIIPARGGSKRLPRKNLRPLAGIPLIGHTILAALECPGLTECIVSTEDAEIKRVSLAYGARVIDRPAHLATDEAQTHGVVAHVLEELQAEGALPDYLVLLQPTSPLRRADHIQACLEAFFASTAACAISVTREEHHPYKDFIVQDGFLEQFFAGQNPELVRQKLPEVYRQNGAIYLMSSELFLSKMVFYIPPALAFIMDQEDGIDVDTEVDFLLSELIMAKRSKSEA